MFYSITSSAALFSSVENFPHCIMSPAVLISTVEKNPLNVEKSPVQSAFIRNFSNDIQSLLEFFRILISWCWKIFDTKIMMSKIFCRRFYCRKFSASPCRKLSITNRLICRKFSVEKSKFSPFTFTWSKNDVRNNYFLSICKSNFSNFCTCTILVA